MEYQGFTIRLNRDFTLYSVHQIGKGALPKDLAGLFTTPNTAKKAIDAYVGSKATVKE